MRNESRQIFQEPRARCLRQQEGVGPPRKPERKYLPICARWREDTPSYASRCSPGSSAKRPCRRPRACRRQAFCWIAVGAAPRSPCQRGRQGHSHHDPPDHRARRRGLTSSAIRRLGPGGERASGVGCPPPRCVLNGVARGRVTSCPAWRWRATLPLPESPHSAGADRVK